MKRIVSGIVGIHAVLMASLAVSIVPGTAAAAKKTITCPFLKAGSVAFDVPAKLGDMPAEIDFDYPAKAARSAQRHWR